MTLHERVKAAVEFLRGRGFQLRTNSYDLWMMKDDEHEVWFTFTDQELIQLAIAKGYERVEK